MKLLWESANDVRNATGSGVVAIPGESSIELIVKHTGAATWFEIPVRTPEMPRDYLDCGGHPADRSRMRVPIESVLKMRSALAVLN